ncbi:MAG: glucose-1-phosphate adenylyltransferase subunit GlgD, partial [Lachnospiraceae bacterium]|nr:glucose-1-phosphate adenylyltransferase subunit GlgD [Lachnospiraceae bacterium]
WYKGQSYFDILDILKENVSHPNMMSYEFKGYVRSINDVPGYMAANLDLLNEKVIKELFMSDRRIKTKIQDSHPAKYLEGSDVKESMIATGCIIEGKIEKSIVFRDCRIEKGAKVKNCVIMANTQIGKNAIVENCIFDKYTRIEEGEKIIGTIKNPIIIENRKV